MQGLQLENSDEGGKHVGYMDEGDLLQFKMNVTSDGVYAFSTRMASAAANSTVRFSVKDEQGITVASSELMLGDTGGWQTYKTVHLPAVPLKAGVTYYVNFEGNEYNTRWLDVSQSQVKNGELTENATDWTLIPNVLSATYGHDHGMSITVPGTTENWWEVLLQQGQLSLEGVKRIVLALRPQHPLQSRYKRSSHKAAAEI